MRAAFSYFTILPAGRPDVLRPETLVWLPLVGVVVGLLAGTLGWAAALLLPAPLSAVVAFGAVLVLTGAIHLDGFLDACDALPAPVSRERRLEILRDPHHGTFALAGLAVVVPLWIGALALVPPLLYAPALAFAGGGARLAAVLNAYRFPYARSDGAAQAFARRPNPLSFAAAAVPVLLCAWATPRWIPLLVPAAAVAVGFGAFAARRLGGGITGDVYGGAIVLAEVVTLAGIAAIVTVR
jgi:adenosylcobinamide-GDP ribazoletransferase